MIKVLRICGKTSDLFSIDCLNEDGRPVLQKTGYVPDFMPGQHFGDYIEIDIEVKTGKILNWKVPTQAQIKRDIRGM